MRILKEDTLCMVIDFQEKLTPAIANHEALIANTRILLEGLQQLEVPFLVTQQYTKGLGKTIPQFNKILERSEKYHPFEKSTFSAYLEKDIRNVLEKSKKKNIILCGVEAHICVLQTLIDLQQSGYQTILVTNCIGSRKESDKQAALLRAQQEGALMTTYEALLFELTQTSTAKIFRDLIQLIK